MLARLLALAAPPACLSCHAPPADAAAPLCPACAAAVPWLGPTCPRCALPRCGGPRDGACPARHAAFAAAWAPWALAGPARALVHALKFRGAAAVADVLAAPMAAGAPPWVPRGPAAAGLEVLPPEVAWAAPSPAAPARSPAFAARAPAAAARAPAAPAALAPHVALVPVPADPLRARRRGLDHAALVAEALGARLDLPVHPCLRRRAGRRRQVGADRAARRAAVAAAVLARGAPPRTALLVDDVHTTGATLDACARVLRAAGARQVLAVTATRAL